MKKSVLLHGFFLLLPTLFLGGCLLSDALVADSASRSCRLQVGLAGESSFTVRSPQLDLQLARAEEPERADRSLPDLETAADDDALPRDLQLEYRDPDNGRRSQLQLSFAEDALFIERAQLSNEMLARTWRLGWGGELAADSDGDLPSRLGLEVDLSHLAGNMFDSPRLVTDPGQEGVLQIPQRLSLIDFCEASGVDPAQLAETLRQEGVLVPADGALPADVWMKVGSVYGLRVEPLGERFRTFQRLSLGQNPAGMQRAALSFGSFLPWDIGEVATTYRLLRESEEGGIRLPGLQEHGLGLRYSADFPAWLRRVTAVAVFYDARLPAEENDPESWSEAGYRKWETRGSLSFGHERSEHASVWLQGVRLDLGLGEEHFALVGEERSRATLIESRLRVRTISGTLFGDLVRAEDWQKLTLGMSKRGVSDSQLRLWVERISDEGRDEKEIRVSGLLRVPLNDWWPDAFRRGRWKVPEDRLFAPLLAGGFASPGDARHVAALAGYTPARLP